ncbi:hypothetical protein [Heliorestis convoluta]
MDPRSALTPSIVAIDDRTLEVKGKGKKLRLTNLDKIFWPNEGYTKGDLLDYYLQIAPYLMPHLQKRPIVMVRHPDGVEGKSFYQKESPSFRPSWLPVLLSTPVRVRSPLPIVS